MKMTEQERYETIDMPFYEKEIRPLLPPEVLDFHTHVWKTAHWKENPWKEQEPGAKYMKTTQEYPMEQLLTDGRRILPGVTYKAVCFGNPTPASDIQLGNAYITECGKQPELYPLMLAGKGLSTAGEIEGVLDAGRIYGYKVFLNWFGNNYGAVTIDDMLSPTEMRIADERRLIVLLHVPRSERLADPVIQQGVRNLSQTYPQAQIVLAHCGRCYLPDEMQRAVKAIKDLDNVYLDSSMVMEPLSIEILLNEIDSSRLLFATDFPVPTMRGRRVYVMDHWVDLVLDGYEPSDFRVMSDNMRASFMVYEIILAIRRAAERVGLSQKQLEAIFYENGKKVIDTVKNSSTD
jgi:hypothetical protein